MTPIERTRAVLGLPQRRWNVRVTDAQRETGIKDVRAASEILAGAYALLQGGLGETERAWLVRLCADARVLADHLETLERDRGAT